MLYSAARNPHLEAKPARDQPDAVTERGTGGSAESMGGQEASLTPLALRGTQGKGLWGALVLKNNQKGEGRGGEQKQKFPLASLSYFTASKAESRLSDGSALSF